MGVKSKSKLNQLMDGPKKSSRVKSIDYDLIIHLHEENERLRCLLEEKNSVQSSIKKNDFFRMSNFMKFFLTNNWKLSLVVIVSVIVVAIILYNIFLPSQTFTIILGSANDNDSSREFFINGTNLLPIQNVNGVTFRELHGLIYAVFSPNISLYGKYVIVDVDGVNVSVISSLKDFSLSDFSWDLFVEFDSDMPKLWVDELTVAPYNGGGISLIDGCGAYFDGVDKIYLPNSYDLFESTPFTVYAEWTPQKANDSIQQIIGHFNWELLQNRDSVQFVVGKMNNNSGVFYSVFYKVNKSFFNQTHSAIAIYNPSNYGYIELFVDGQFAGRTSIKREKIWAEYNNFTDLSIGKSSHTTGTYFNGCISRILIANSVLDIYPKNAEFIMRDDTLIIPISGDGVLRRININVK